MRDMRTRHAAAVERAEKTVRGAVNRAVTGWRDRVKAGVLGAAERVTERLPDLDLWPEPTVWSDLVGNLIVPVLRRVHRDWWTDSVVGQAGSRRAPDGTVTVEDPDGRPVILDPDTAWRAYQAKVVARLSEVALPIATLELVRQVIADGVGRGDTPAVITVAVEAVLDRDTSADVDRIAETETVAATNAAQWAAHADIAAALELDVVKTWVSMRDDAVRATHRVVDGQAVGVSDRFQVGPAALLYPGDPAGPVGEVIHCRCFCLYSLAPPRGVVAASTHLTEASVDIKDGWRGVLAPLGTLSGDGRILAKPDELVARELPRPLKFQPADAPGHDGAVVVGSITRVWIEADSLMGEGRFDLEDPVAAEVARKVGEGFAGWVSVDLDDDGNMIVTERCLRDGVQVDCETVSIEDWESGAVRSVVELAGWRLMSATLVADAAFDEARIEVVDDPEPAEDEEEVEEDEEEPVSVAASATSVLLAPPSAWFARPDFAAAPRGNWVHVTDEGRVFGYIALWDTCHTGYPGACLAPPKMGQSHPYSRFHTGLIRTSEGEEITVGRLSIATGHAHPNADYAAANAHYDDTGSIAAFVRCGEDEHGIWVAGSIAPGATPEQVFTLRAAELSGDWRRIDGQLELIIGHTVNSGGFNSPRAAVKAGRQLSLVASGARVRRRPPVPESAPLTSAALTAALLTAHTRAQRLDRFAAGLADERRRRVQEITREVMEA